MEILLLADILGAQATVNQMRFTGRVPRGAAGVTAEIRAVLEKMVALVGGE